MLNKLEEFTVKLHNDSVNLVIVKNKKIGVLATTLDDPLMAVAIISTPGRVQLSPLHGWDLGYLSLQIAIHTEEA